jgi:hypothetical protein
MFSHVQGLIVSVNARDSGGSIPQCSPRTTALKGHGLHRGRAFAKLIGHARPLAPGIMADLRRAVWSIRLFLRHLSR